MSPLITSTNSLRPSSLAPLSASFKSWARRASDSMMRSSTTSWAILLAVCCDRDGLKAFTFAAMPTEGNDGTIHTRADPETGPEFAAGGRVSPALLKTQEATPGPAPTVSVTAGVEPSESPDAGVGL